MNDSVEKVPSIGISYTTELPGKKALVLQSFVERDCEAVELNRTLDKIRVACDRQFAFGMLEHLRLQLEQEEKLARDHVLRMAQVDENVQKAWQTNGKRGDPRLSQRQEQEQRQAHAHAEESRRRIAKVKADMAEFEAKIGI